MCKYMNNPVCNDSKVILSYSSIDVPNHSVQCCTVMNVQNSSACKNTLEETLDSQQRKGRPLPLVINIIEGGKTDKARLSQ